MFVETKGLIAIEVRSSCIYETPSPAEPPKLDAGGLGEVGKVLGEALNAAATVDASSATPCEQAYDGIEAMKQALEKSGKAASGKPMPPKSAFLRSWLREMPLPRLGTGPDAPSSFSELRASVSRRSKRATTSCSSVTVGLLDRKR